MSAVETTVLRVELGDRGYPIRIGAGLLSEAATATREWLGARPGAPSIPARPTGLIVTDEHVAPHSGTLAEVLARDGWKLTTVTLPPGEQTKCIPQWQRLLDELIALGADRHSVLFAVGGGVVGDLAGFAAASYARGIPFVQIPTTLLAAVDSSVGGKTGINHPDAKNMIGAFHQPLGVFIELPLLETLPRREYVSGLAEVVKYGVIRDPDLFAFLEEHVEALLAREPAALRHIIARSCRIKADVVEQDEFERFGLRAILNYGHTFAHAFEALCGYGTLLHGEAVSLGMVCAARLADRLGLIPTSLAERQSRLLARLELPTTLPQRVLSASEPLTPEALIACMRLDKKSVGGSLRFILPTRLGHVELKRDVPEPLVVEVLQEFLACV